MGHAAWQWRQKVIDILMIGYMTVFQKYEMRIFINYRNLYFEDIFAVCDVQLQSEKVQFVTSQNRISN